MRKVINMQQYLNRQEYKNEISYFTEQLSKHKLKYNKLSNRKVVIFRKNRLKNLEALIKSDKQGIEIYTRLYCNDISSFEEGLSTSTVM